MKMQYQGIALTWRERVCQVLCDAHSRGIGEGQAAAARPVPLSADGGETMISIAQARFLPKAPRALSRAAHVMSYLPYAALTVSSAQTDQTRSSPSSPSLE